VATNRAIQSIKVGPLKESELGEADRIVRLAFGTFFGLANPLECMGDRHFMTPRWRSSNVKVIAAREGDRLVGSNVITRWGSFGFFGPLTVQPEYWDRGVAQRLMEATMTTFDRWGVRHTGLYTFAHSAKHVGLYQKFGYWPRYLTGVMTLAPDGVRSEYAKAPMVLSALKKSERESAIEACGRLTHRIDKGLDLGGEKTCYVKFGAARGGAGAAERFDRMLVACEAFASSRGATVEAGVNMAREDAYRCLRSRGYRVDKQGVAMQRPHLEGFNRADAFVIDDWR
jgi:GNAT superfamily N-acetyltransferase